MATSPSKLGFQRRCLRERGHLARATKASKESRRRPNLFIDAEADVDGYASGNKRLDDKNDDLDGFIVAHNIEF